MKITIPTWFQDCLEAKAQLLAEKRMGRAVQFADSRPTLDRPEWVFEAHGHPIQTATVTLSEALRALLAED